MLTQTELNAIKERAEKATAGPWRIGRQSPNGLNNVGTIGGLLTAQTTDKENAEFIANAREDIPKLVAEIERLQNIIGSIRVLADYSWNSQDAQLEFIRLTADEVNRNDER